MLIRTIRIRIMRTLTFLLTLLMATALQAQPLLDEASSTLQPALQQLGRRLLRHKTGSIVAIQPATGRDHSAFIGFAPMDDPAIAVCVYIEHGGFGADTAAPIASLLIEQHLTGHLSPASQRKASLLEAKSY